MVATDPAATAIFNAAADSLQILYYDDPDGDSLRYSRFYSYVSTADTLVLNTLMSDLHRPFVETGERRQCRSEGKIYLYGDSEPLKTIYFSTRENGCRYLYLIRDGNFLYFDMGPETVRMLEQQQAGSIKP